MDMSGEKRVPASRDTVWAALNDPEILKLAIPGCESVEKKSDTEFTARVSLAIGPVKAKFKGEVTLADLDPPNGYTLSGTGSGGVAGFGKGEANVSLRDDGEGTIIVYQVHASVGGKLAQVGQRLIDSTAKKLADQFFTNLSAQLGGGKDEAAPAAAPASAPAPAATPACSQAITFWALAIAGLFALWIVNH
jgi:carbon monoxide dehydrogenase subunit G